MRRVLLIPALTACWLATLAQAGPAQSAQPTCSVGNAADTPASARWTKLNGPPEGLISAGQTDADPCLLLGVSERGAVWSTRDGGRHWIAGPTSPALDGVLTENLQVESPDGKSFAGPVLAVGRATDPTGAPSLLVSHDLGKTFKRAQTTPSPGTGLPSSPPIDTRGRLLSASAAAHYEGGRPRNYLYAVIRDSLAGDAQEKAATSTLLKSTDGGDTFSSPGTGLASVAPSVVAINPAAPDEIWVNDTRGTGVYRSVDGGRQFSSMCCVPPTKVHDIAITPSRNGYVQILLATDSGLLKSVDDGSSWVTIHDQPSFGVRTAPDSPGTILIETESGVMASTKAKLAFAALPGLPASCVPSLLRRAAVVPPVFLVNCGSSAIYRLRLDTYFGAAAEDAPPPAPSPTDVLGALPGDYTRPAGRPITPLATWALPGSNLNSGAIAFGGTAIYYDRNTPGDIGVVDARSGRFVGVLTTHLSILSLTVDLKRNQLIIGTSAGDLYGLGLATRSLTRLSAAPSRVPSYDSASDGFSYVPETGHALYRAPRGGGAGRVVCNISGTGIVSTFVAAGDGGGYIQDEDDATLTRIDKDCVLRGTFSHRVFSESGLENDALACDTQTYFPQAAMWIRDSVPGTVTSYGVPYGYCPMPSRVALSAPVLPTGSIGSLCAVLRNATTGQPAIRRPMVLSVAGVQIGRGQTDLSGQLCLPYAAPPGIVGVVNLPARATFAGDSSLYPSVANGRVQVRGSLLPHPPLALVPVVIIPPAVPPALPGPLGAAGSAPAPVPGPGPDAAQAAQGQAQAQSNAGAQAVVVPQRQQQAQLALVQAADAVTASLERNGINPMTALSGHSPARRGPNTGQALLACLAGLAVTRQTWAWRRDSSRR
jgi:hypothetical protein